MTIRHQKALRSLVPTHRGLRTRFRNLASDVLELISTSSSVKLMLFSFFITIAGTTSGQVFPACHNNDNCDAQDFVLCSTPAYIADPNTGMPINSCTPGEEVTAAVVVCVTNQTSANRYAIRIATNLTIDGVQNVVVDCFVNTLPGQTDTAITVGTFTFDCGACIEFGDFIIGYSTANNTTCASVTTNGGFECDKCQRIEDFFIPPLTPLGVTCPADVNVVCIDDTTSVSEDSLAISQGLIADCNPVTITLLSQTDVGNCGVAPGRTITRNFQITDGNTTLFCTRRNFILDQSPPVLTCPSPPAGTCALAEAPPYADLDAFLSDGGIASDNCGLDSMSFVHLGDVSNGMTCPVTYTRTYQISDLCGNTMTCMQSIVIDDVTSPTLTCPADVQVSCFGQVPPPYADLTEFEGDMGQAMDNCAIDRASFQLVEELQSGACPTTITREYMIADICGNPATCLHTITIDDNAGPSVNCPANQTLSCLGDLPAPFTTYAAFQTGGGSAMDNCGIDESTFTVDPDIIIGSCPTIISRTYRLQDSCQNEGSCTQVFTIDDQTMPTLTCPALGPFECLAEVPAPYPDYGAFSAAGGSNMDNCGVVEGTFTLLSETGPSGLCPMVIVRTYAISDSCDNQGTCTQTITIDDDTYPIILCPPNASVACAGALGTPYTDLAAFLAAGGSVDDNCGIDAGTFALDDQISSGSCPTTITRTYGISDTCGNRSNCTQTLQISDQSPPTITCPADLNYECLEDVPPPYADLLAFQNDGGTATDNCGFDANTFSITETVTGSCPIIIRRTYSLKDLCGNTGSCQQVITVEDVSAPQINNCAANVVVGCRDTEPTLADLPVSSETIASLGITDNCQASLVLSHMDMGPTIDGCSYTFTRRYYVVDGCLNIDSCDQLYFFTYDTTAPVISGLEGIEFLVTIGCDDDFPAAPAVTAYDDCVGALSVDFQQVADANGCLSDGITRRWSVTDACGNTEVVVQRLSREDLSAPRLIRGPDTTLQCGAEIPENIYEIEDDGCTLVRHEVREETIGSDCICEYTLLRIWTIWDACNTVIDTQRIEIKDTQAPEIELVNPNLVGVEHGGIVVSYVCDLPRVYPSDINVSDCCETGDVFVYDSLIAADKCEIFGYYRRWKCGYIVSDACGNSTEFSFYMDQYDTLPPEFQVDSTFVDYELDCGDSLPPLPDVQIVDNCTPEPLLTLEIDTIGIDADTFAIVRTWEAKDPCGNTASISQVVSYCGFELDSFAATIGNIVWLDENRDGVQNPDEPGINGILVNIYQDQNMDGIGDHGILKSRITSTRHGTKGAYYFDNIAPGTYLIEFVLGDEYQFTEPYMGEDATMDSDVDPSTGISQPIVVGPGMMEISVDAGLVQESRSLELTHFEVRPANCHYELLWTVSDGEVDAYLEIEYSPDGFTFHKLGLVALEGIGSADYQFLHQKPQLDNYYRLKLVQADGTISISEVIYAAEPCAGNLQVVVYPNPVRDELILQYQNGTGGTLSLELFDALGKRIFQRQLSNPGQDDFYALGMGKQPEGTYWLKVTDRANSKLLPIVKIR